MTTPYMLLDLPVVSSTIGPTWASMLNAAISSGIDSHNHTATKGVQIPTGGININADLPFNGYNATAVRSLRFMAQDAPLALGTDNGCLFEVGVDLCYRDGNGNLIQLTAGGALNAASIGGIGGDYSTSSASVFYTTATTTYSFWTDTNKSGNIDCGKVIIREPGVASAHSITLQSPTSLAADKVLTLPQPAGSTQLVQLSSSGTLTPTASIASFTITTFASTTATLTTGNISTANIGVLLAVNGAMSGSLSVGTTLAVTGTATFGTIANITTGNLTTGNITTGNITTANIGTANISTNLDLTMANVAATTGMSNRLNKANIPKCWGSIDISTASPTVLAGFNIASVSYTGGNTLRVNLAVGMDSSDYCVVATSTKGTYMDCYCAVTSSDHFFINTTLYNSDTLMVMPASAYLNATISFQVFGTQ